MTINVIIKKAVERIKKENKLLTPDFYAEAFCKEAQIAGILVADCNQIDKHVNNLDKKYQEELKQYRIKTIDELLRFIVSKLNRMNPSNSAKLIESQSQLLKRILSVSGVLHNKEVSELSSKTADGLDNGADSTKLDNYRQLWMNFLTTYDDTFLQKLSKVTKVNSKDLKSTINGINLSGFSAEAKVEQSFTLASKLLIASLVPSIASSANDEIANVTDTLRKDPELLTSKSMAYEVKEAISLRIALDKASVKEMVQSLDIVLDKLSHQLISLIERTDTSTVEIQAIKKDLEKFDVEAVSDFSVAHKKLYSIAVNLEEQTAALGVDLKTHNKELQDMGNRISILEKELQEAKEASKEDFLTKLANRRALDEYLKIKEGEFERYGRDYSLVMFDIDLFKNVNDTYGHDAGDAVLAGFAKVLQSKARNVDVVGRFGGEEFLVILSNSELPGALIFAEKVRKSVQSTKFMYKGQRIDVTVSGGVSHRKQFSSQKESLDSADEQLYAAKDNGRNRVEPQA